MTRHVTQT